VEEEGTAGFPPPPPKNPHERKTRNPTETETHTVMRDDPFLRPPVESRLEIGTEKFDRLVLPF
jgi:hypothetical protein